MFLPPDCDPIPLSIAEKYIIEPTKSYTFLSQNDMTVGGIDDAEEFAATMQALRIMGVTDDDLDSIWKVVSGVMLFGNMEFKQERNSDQAILSDDTVAQKVRKSQGRSAKLQPSHVTISITKFIRRLTS